MGKKSCFPAKPALNLSSTQPNAQWKKLRITGMILTAAGAAGTAIGIKLARDNSQVAYENKGGIRNTTRALPWHLFAPLFAGGITLWAISKHKKKESISLTTTGTTMGFVYNF